MKLAILGSSPLALEAAVRFHLHGASLTWFNSADAEPESYFEEALAPETYTSEAGRSLISGFELPKTFSYAQWKESYLLPLTNLFRSEQRVRTHKVVSVAKRYLDLDETLSRSRFQDLFRIIFQVNPQEFIKEQKASNPETFERLSQELLESLQKDLEMYEDFDLVIDLRHSTDPRSLSVSGRALGEHRVSGEQMKSGFEALDLARSIDQDMGDVREMALIGSGSLAAEVVSSLGDWLKDPRTRLFVISHEAWPFEHYLQTATKESKQKLEAVFTFMDQEFEKEINEFHAKLREWQELDDYVQVKKTRPVEPISRLVFFSGHNASAVDQLIDKRRLFLTIEKPEFREGRRHPENNPLDLKTIGVDRVLIAQTLQKPKIELHLRQDEVGFLSAEVSSPNEAQAWTQDLEKLKGIEHEIFKLFSPAGAH